MEHLWSAWEEILHRLNAASLVYLLMDYDGTLTPIVARPELATLAPAMRWRLRRLAAHPHYRVAIISGRPLPDIKKRVGVRELAYAGNHGLELQFQGKRLVHPQTSLSRPVLTGLAHTLTLALADVPGSLVEDKGLTLSLHYRQVEPAGILQVRRAVRDLALPLARLGKLRITRGKKVYEFRPPLEWDKGRAIAWLLEQWHNNKARKALPLFLGDDRTDEDGFRETMRLGGIAIRVGKARRSLAPYYLLSPAEVGELLERLLS